MPRPRPKGIGYKPLPKEEILERYFIQGESVIKIARSLGVSDQTIYNRFQEWKIKTKGHKKNGRK